MSKSNSHKLSLCIRRNGWPPGLYTHEEKMRMSDAHKRLTDADDPEWLDYRVGCVYIQIESASGEKERFFFDDKEDADFTQALSLLTCMPYYGIIMGFVSALPDDNPIKQLFAVGAIGASGFAAFFMTPRLGGRRQLEVESERSRNGDDMIHYDLSEEQYNKIKKFLNRPWRGLFYSAIFNNCSTMAYGVLKAGACERPRKSFMLSPSDFHRFAKRVSKRNETASKLKTTPAQPMMLSDRIKSGEFESRSPYFF
ncbi:MAG: hypothetical protein GC136_09925 [Alphaproteobacteria bacterium]|nr:hypothetical protein [Alphaproteobacteria bacterium]